jgi:predicted Zn finger-like uncharacterized protein
MRIRCTGCGREYRVSEERLTGEEVRAKCRSCGKMLRIRVRRNDPAELAETPPAQSPEPLREPDSAQPIGSGAYRYCIACGGFLDQPVPSKGRPLCTTCVSDQAARRKGLTAGVAADVAAAGRRGRFFFYMAILLAVLVSAYFGYRLAAGLTTAVAVSGGAALETAPDPADRAG